MKLTADIRGKQAAHRRVVEAAEVAGAETPTRPREDQTGQMVPVREPVLGRGRRLENLEKLLAISMLAVAAHTLGLAVLEGAVMVMVLPDHPSIMGHRTPAEVLERITTRAVPAS